MRGTKGRAPGRDDNRLGGDGGGADLDLLRPNEAGVVAVDGDVGEFVAIVGSALGDRVDAVKDTVADSGPVGSSEGGADSQRRSYSVG